MLDKMWKRLLSWVRPVYMITWAGTAEEAIAAGYVTAEQVEHMRGTMPVRCPFYTTVAGDPWHGCSLLKHHEGRHDYTVRLYGAYPEYGIPGPEEVIND